MAQSQYEIIQELRRFPDVPGSEYHKELNIISWYGKQPCYDLQILERKPRESREWDLFDRR